MKHKKKYKNLKVKDIFNICNSRDNCINCPLISLDCCAFIDYDNLNKEVEYEIKTNKCK